MATKDLSDYKLEQLEIINDISIGILVSEWNQEITRSLLEGSLDTLKKYGVKDNQLQIETVPGSYELPTAAQMMVKFAEVDAVICLGTIIQGETRHFEFISQSVSQGLNRVALDYTTPVIFGILTTENLEQAHERAGGKHGNKGVEAAASALKMLSLEYKLLSEALPEDEDLEI